MLSAVTGKSGSLITEFGKSGALSFSAPGATGSTTVSGLISAPHDTFIAVGSASDRGKIGIFLSRYRLADGAVAPMRGYQGTVFYSPREGVLNEVTAGTPCDWNAVAAKANEAVGKVVVLSHIQLGGTSVGLGLCSYNQDGTYDKNFGFRKAGALGLNNITPTALAIQNDGKILVGGSSAADTHGNNAFTLIRYTQNGMLDGSFGKGGVVRFCPFPAAQQRIYGIAVQEDGKIVTTGVVTAGSVFAIVTCRFNANGTLDKTFNSVGPFASQGYAVATPGDAGLAVAFSVALQKDRKIIVAGYAKVSSMPSQEQDMVAYDTTATGDDSTKTQLIRYKDASSATLALVLLCYNEDGTRDETFGQGNSGMVLTKIGEWGTMPFAVATQSDGKIVVAARATFYDEQSNFLETFALARYTPSGELDSSFDSAREGSSHIPGVTIMAVGRDAMPQSLLLSVDKITVGGYAINDDRGFYDGVIAQCAR